MVLVEKQFQEVFEQKPFGMGNCEDSYHENDIAEKDLHHEPVIC